MSQIPRIHVGLAAKDLERSVAFYTRAFGAEPTKRRADYARFEVLDPPLNLSLNPSDAGAPGGPFHLGVQLPDAGSVDAWRARLEAAEVKLLVQDETECCYAKLRRVWMEDPDGHRWEIFANLDDQSEKRTDEVCCQPKTSGGCC